ncbi:uncharacterized protein UV8b_01674 [Ustilaginoidea virens]|uniref:SET domain-containing protein n=1 Tax=Ustilaginoidea virens TaxID=1159556 RepID=A0A063BRF5_USTVR|nr:uncharacterized protein UV8b_01674 [Ustilaginoidea virens]QUC17433.1 hypothetical protein UV8b_01674 [Ustilaginoidea virens]GAO13694.1 hypothetical protein UVI_02017960 [Ustilaginoidea virens]
MGSLAAQAGLLVCALAALSSAAAPSGADVGVLGQKPLEPILFQEIDNTSPRRPRGLDVWLPTNAPNATEYRAYSSKGFAGGRGISIITTRQRIASFAHVSRSPDTNTHSSGLFEKREVPGKGRGLFATKWIRRGDRLFTETPILLIDDSVYVKGVSMVEALEDEAIGKLPPDAQEAFWSLHAKPSVAHAATARIDPNAFEIPLGQANYYGVFPDISLINHECRPNTAYEFDAKTLTHSVYAIMDIPPGAELSLTYIDVTRTREERMERLRHGWGFNCTCSSCSLQAELSDASDKRLVQIDDLESRLGNGGWEFASLEMAEALISLYQQEQLDIWLSSAYGYAALMHCAEGNYWKTIRYAHLAVESHLLNASPSDIPLANMRKIAKDPTKESCWLIRVRGGTGTDDEVQSR